MAHPVSSFRSLGLGTSPAFRRRFRNERLLSAVAALVSGGLAATYASNRVDNAGLLPAEWRSTLALFVELVPAIIVLGLIFLVGQRRRWSGFVAFFAWLPFEDLARKFSGNDLRLYFVKYALFGVAVLLVWPRIRELVRPAFGRLTRPTLVVLTCALAYSVPSVFIGGWKTPAIGIVVRFFFIGLVPVGYYLGLDAVRFRRALGWLGFISAAISSVGIAQAIIGPQFLNPAAEIASLPHLVILRSGGQVVQPAGPFVDVARFASMTTITVLLGVVLLRLAESRSDRTRAAIYMVIGLVASFASAGRASLVFSTVIAIAGMVFARGRAASGRLATAGAAVLVVVVIFLTGGNVVGDLTSGRTEFFSSTLNPFGRDSEIVPRTKYYGRNVVAGVRNGHYVGLGTGNQSIGTQYFDSAKRVGKLSESGWGQVAIEWGVLGLAIWVWWAILWLTRAVSIARNPSRMHGIGPAASPIALWLVLILGLYFGFGANFFDNYITNIFFWMLSGAVFASEKLTVEDMPYSDTALTADTTASSIV